VADLGAATNGDPVLTALLAQIVSTLGLPANLSVADLGVAHTEAAADSDGGANGVPADRSQAGAANIFPDTVLSSISLAGILTEIEATAPPSETVTDNLLGIVDPNPLAQVLELEVSPAAATANWVSDTECVASDTPISRGRLDTAGATVLKAAGDGGLANTGAGVTDITSSTDLPATGGPNDQRAIRATSSGQLDDLGLLLDNVGVDVVAPPATLVAQATGIPGGATLSYTQPTVVSLADQTIIDAPTLESLIEDALGPVIGLINGLGLITIDAQVQTAFTEQGAPDGTSASGSTAFVTIDIDLLDLNLVHLELLPMTASAVAPTGGIFCGNPPDDSNPLELQKVNSGPAVPGSSFDYTIAVGNVSDCVMNPVAVVDTVVGPTGTTIGVTEPSGATVTDLGDGDWRISWPNVGPIAPDGRTTLRIRVNVGANAPIGERFTDTVTGTASIQAGPGCTPRDVTRTRTLNEPEVVAPPSGPCNVTGSTKGKSHIEVYPGESFVYYVNVLNGGGEACHNVTVVDAIDSRLTFESCSDGCSFTAPNATWNIGTLAPGQSVTLRLQVKVNAGATGNLANTATIDTDETGPTNVSTTGPNITTNSIEDQGNPARIPNRDLARTGGPASLPVPVLLALGCLAVGAWNVRRRLSA
jgi:uncharacterized repeat protein (TIGR01451 family)